MHVQEGGALLGPRSARCRATRGVPPAGTSPRPGTICPVRGELGGSPAEGGHGWDGFPGSFGDVLVAQAHHLPVGCRRSLDTHVCHGGLIRTPTAGLSGTQLVGAVPPSCPIPRAGPHARGQVTDVGLKPATIPVPQSVLGGLG